MWQNFVTWLQEPGKWNDAAFACGVLAIICFAWMIVDHKEKP